MRKPGPLDMFQFVPLREVFDPCCLFSSLFYRLSSIFPLHCNTRKPGPRCGCLLSAKPMWSPTPSPNYLMTRDASSDAYASISFIPKQLFMCVSVIPACNSSCVMSCACTGLLGDSNNPDNRGRPDRKCQSVSAIQTEKVPGRRSGPAQQSSVNISLGLSCTKKKTCYCTSYADVAIYHL